MKHSKKKFASLCGIETKNLSVYIGRKKVIVENDLIDDSDPANRLFIEKCKLRVPKIKTVPAKGKSRSVKESKNSLLMSAEAKAELDLLKRQNEIDLQKLEIQKKRGELVPVEGIASLLIVHSESIKVAYMDGSENLLNRISQKKQLTSTERSDLGKELKVIVNNAIDQAIAASKKTLLSVTQDYSRKRGVGQHD